MSQADLEIIQCSLKTAVTKHKEIISQLNRDPMNLPLKQTLIGLQKHINMLADKQKILVQRLQHQLFTSSEYLDNSGSKSPSEQTPEKSRTGGKVRRSMSSGFVVVNDLDLDDLDDYDDDLDDDIDDDLDDDLDPDAIENSALQADDDDDLDDLDEAQPPAAQSYNKLYYGPSTSCQIQQEGDEVTSAKGDETGDSITEGGAPMSLDTPATVVKSLSEPYDKKDLIEVDADLNDTSLLRKVVSEYDVDENTDKEKLLFMAAMCLSTPDLIQETLDKRNNCDKRFIKLHSKNEPTPHNFDTIIPLPIPGIRRRGRPKKQSKNMLVTKAYKFSSNHIDEAQLSRPEDHEDFCYICFRSGDLLMCDTCSKVYHMACLDPPLTLVPDKEWVCVWCQKKSVSYRTRMKAAHEYICSQINKKNEIAKCQQQGLDLSIEKNKLEQKNKNISQTLEKIESELLEIRSQEKYNTDKASRIKRVFLSGQNWV